MDILEMNKRINEPFLLHPAGKDYLWGGRRLKDEFGKELNMDPLAESWECSTHPDGQSTAASGPFAGRTLAEVLKEHPEYLGSRNSGKDFPILIKLIDAKADLSVQVHPDDEFAAVYENGQRGKTEMWYVLDAGRNAKLVYGLNHDCEPEELREAIESGTVMKHLQFVPIRKNDVFLIEAGTIHAICEGALVAEIQENSNLTYRLYDYDRTDKCGRKRSLHVEKGLMAANLKSMVSPRQPMRVLKYRPGAASELLCRCRYFEVYRMLINTERRQKVLYHADELSFRVLLCVDGCGSIDYGEKQIRFYKGDCIFVPADSPVLTLTGVAQLLDVRG